MSLSKLYEDYYEILSTKKNWELTAWQLFHIRAYLYPDNPTEDDKIEILDFYRRQFIMYILCINCVRHYLSIIDIDVDDVKNSSSLLKWTQKIHNMINRKLNKRIFNESIEEWFKMGFYNLPDNEEQVTMMREFMSNKEQVELFSKFYDEDGRKKGIEFDKDMEVKKNYILFSKAQDNMLIYGIPLFCVICIILYIYKNRRNRSTLN